MEEERSSGRREEEREGERKRQKGVEGEGWSGRYRLKYICLIH